MRTFRFCIMALLSVLMAANLSSCSTEEIVPDSEQNQDNGNQGDGEGKVEQPNGIPSNIPTNIIYYITNDNIIIRFDNEDVFGGAKIESNTYSTTKGYGTIEFKSEVTAIEARAFIEEGTLTYIALPNSVKTIGERAFEGCSGLTSVSIPASVTSIGKFAFNGCNALTSVRISDLVAWCNIVFYQDDGSNPLQYARHLYLNGKEVKDLVIPNGIKSINAFAFACCTGLTSVTFPNSVTAIGDYSFLCCTGLTSVAFPSNVSNIGEGAFEECTINTCYSYATNPPSIFRNSFEKTENVLYVPEESFDAYIHSDWARNFKYIAKIGSTDDFYETLTPAEKTSGLYHVRRLSTLIGLPPSLIFTPIEDKVQLVVKVEADYFVKINFPATKYNISGQEMVIPEFSLSGVPVVDDNEGGASILSHHFKIEGAKNITGTISGDFDDDGEVDLTIKYTYGNMPFPIQQEFKTVTEN